MSTPESHKVHLLTADDVVLEGHWGGTYLALCGVLLAAEGLPESLCPEGCECDTERLYCPEWVREADRCGADAGLVERASGASQ